MVFYGGKRLFTSVIVFFSLLFRLVSAEHFAANRIYGVLKQGVFPPPGGAAIAVSRDNSSSSSTSQLTASWPWPQLPPFLAGAVRIFTPDTIPRWQSYFQPIGPKKIYNQSLLAVICQFPDRTVFSLVFGNDTSFPEFSYRSSLLLFFYFM